MATQRFVQRAAVNGRDRPGHEAPAGVYGATKVAPHVYATPRHAMKRLLRLQRQYAGYKLLIVDELGYVPLSQTGAELLFEVFSQVTSAAPLS